MRVLIAEDDKSIAQAIARRLKAEQYCVDVCHDGDSAYDYLVSTEYDVAILDIMMPRQDGLSVVRKIRNNSIATPILFLTALDTIANRVEGLEAGGDDYLIKPFAFEELIARLRVLVRRANDVRQTSDIYTIADLSLDTRTRIVKRGDKQLSLSSREYAMLEYLIRNKGTVLSRSQIESHVWSYDYEGASNMVDVYIRYLRKKIDDGFDNKLIHTVKYAGYVLRED